MPPDLRQASARANSNGVFSLVPTHILESADLLSARVCGASHETATLQRYVGSSNVIFVLTLSPNVSLFSESFAGSRSSSAIASQLEDSLTVIGAPSQSECVIVQTRESVPLLMLTAYSPARRHHARVSIPQCCFGATGTTVVGWATAVAKMRAIILRSLQAIALEASAIELTSAMGRKRTFARTGDAPLTLR